MHSVQPAQVTPTLQALFDPADPASHRCLAVLDGLTVGTILTDDPDRPAWAVAQEACDDGQTHLGGTLDAPTLGRLVTTLRATGDVLVGGWPGDPRLALLPADPDYTGWVLDWVGRRTDVALDSLRRVPAGCMVLPIDPPLLDRCAGRDGIVGHFGGEERFFAHGFGFCLLEGADIACEVFACPAVRGMRELWVETHAPYRRKGYATVTCAHAIGACEALGQQTYWNTAKQNHASIALAHRLGYGQAREYQLVGWSRQVR
jgi:hypothetical protein